MLENNSLRPRQPSFKTRRDILEFWPNILHFSLQRHMKTFSGARTFLSAARYCARSGGQIGAAWPFGSCCGQECPRSGSFGGAIEKGRGWAVLAVLLSLSVSGLGAEELSTRSARTAPAWVRDGVVYEIFPRNFSAEGDFN